MLFFIYIFINKIINKILKILNKNNQILNKNFEIKKNQTEKVLLWNCKYNPIYFLYNLFTFLLLCKLALSNITTVLYIV